MIVAHILCQWQGGGTRGNPFRPALDGLPILGIVDITSQPGENLPPEPNVVAVRIEVADEAALALVDAAPGVVVLDAEEVEDVGTA